MVMEIVKKNLVSILCGVVAVICVILIFFPLGGMYESLTEDVKKSQSLGSSIDGVKNSPRTWPTLSNREEDKVALQHFPTQATVEVARQQTTNWTREADNFLTSAIQRQQSQLHLLVPNSLPGNPGQQAIAYEFMDKYKKAFGIAKPAAPVAGQPVNPSDIFDPKVNPDAIFNTIIKAVLPPTDAEVKALQDQEAALVAERMTKRDDRGQVTNQPDIDAAVIKRREDVAIEARLRPATKGTVYLDPIQVFKPAATMNRPVAPNPNEIFEAQVGLWIQQEICHAIADVNAGAKQGVIDAPLKRVMDLKFTIPYFAAPQTGPVTEPPQVPQKEDALVHVDYVKNPLGHVASEFFDVIPIHLTVICEADRLPEVLTKLTANRYMMSKRVEMISVDSALAFAQGYLYGSKPVVQLNIDGQYLMLRKFIAPLMPPDIARGLATPPAQPPA